MKQHPSARTFTQSDPLPGLRVCSLRAAFEATPKLTVYPGWGWWWYQHQTSHDSIFFFCFCFFFSTDVGAFFEEGMWLRYNFQSAGTSGKESGSRWENSPEQQSSPLDLAREEIQFSFSTMKPPCILLYVSSLSSDFLAVLVKPSGKDRETGHFMLGGQNVLVRACIILALSLTPHGMLSKPSNVSEPHFPLWDPGKQLVGWVL